mgnify:CR=1 FL=1|tara:strand:- start:578 stop:751 length:174 start_codon:yes stop_codon:yes gene_type:complete
MKYKATKKFNELTAMNNYEGLGIENFQALERGEEVELKEQPQALLDGKFIEKVKESK